MRSGEYKKIALSMLIALNSVPAFIHTSSHSLEALAQVPQQLPVNEPLISQVLREYSELRSSGHLQDNVMKNTNVYSISLDINTTINITPKDYRDGFGEPFQTYNILVSYELPNRDKRLIKILAFEKDEVLSVLSVDEDPNKPNHVHFGITDKGLELSRGNVRIPQLPFVTLIPIEYANLINLVVYDWKKIR